MPQNTKHTKTPFCAKNVTKCQKSPGKHFPSINRGSLNLQQWPPAGVTLPSKDLFQLPYISNCLNGPTSLKHSTGLNEPTAAGLKGKSLRGINYSGPGLSLQGDRRGALKEERESKGSAGAAAARVQSLRGGMFFGSLFLGGGGESENQRGGASSGLDERPILTHTITGNIIQGTPIKFKVPFPSSSKTKNPETNFPPINQSAFPPEKIFNKKVL